MNNWDIILVLLEQVEKIACFLNVEIHEPYVFENARSGWSKHENLGRHSAVYYKPFLLPMINYCAYVLILNWLQEFRRRARCGATEEAQRTHSRGDKRAVRLLRAETRIHLFISLKFCFVFCWQWSRYWTVNAAFREADFVRKCSTNWSGRRRANVRQQGIVLFYHLITAHNRRLHVDFSVTSCLSFFSTFLVNKSILKRVVEKEWLIK